ncbi:ATP-binding cassette domain-containing protein [Streptomyces sp. NPDC001404]|uniref:ATP-binding cassette domain-containing protein n=1 Tax=Streptomyces sp. NPDC001404 TaxID=3364571 RepID=UPI0036CAB1BD
MSDSLLVPSAARDTVPPAAGRALVTRVGSAADNDVVVPSGAVGRHHARLWRAADGTYEIEDLDSPGGTWVNGRPVRRARVGRRDVVHIEHAEFRLVGGRLARVVRSAGDICLTARSLSTSLRQYGRRKTLLDDVTLSLPANSLVAVIGPSGAGKSTLLRALTGYEPAGQGEVRYQGLDLYENFSALRREIGFVPQDDILHTQLTVRTALRYAAELRCPSGTSRSARHRRVDEVLAELSLTHRGGTRIDALSGGQRKRVSVALELLTKPSLLFLDEPTSGLDPGLDRQVMQMLRDLADGGRTVVLTTHSVTNLALCDRLLVLAPGGRTAYFGPPAEGLEFFGRDDWADVFQDLELSPNRYWADGYRESAQHRMYISEAARAVAPQAALRRSEGGPRPPRWTSQVRTLVLRHLSVIAADRGYAVLLVCLPLLMGVLSWAVPAPDGFMTANQDGIDAKLCLPRFNTDASRVVVMLAIGACLTGMANSVRELVHERVIYQRERATGLSRSAYAMSKVVVLGTITALQGLCIAGIGLLGRPLPKNGVVLSWPTAELLLVIAMLSVASMILGLMVSALVRTVEKTMPLLVVATLFQIMATSAVFPIFNRHVLAQLAWFAPSRWAVGALAATVDLGKVGPPADAADPGLADTVWKHQAVQWCLDFGILFAMCAAGALLVVRMLRRHEPAALRRK